MFESDLGLAVVSHMFTAVENHVMGHEGHFLDYFSLFLGAIREPFVQTLRCWVSVNRSHRVGAEDFRVRILVKSFQVFIVAKVLPQFLRLALNHSRKIGVRKIDFLLHSVVG